MCHSTLLVKKSDVFFLYHRSPNGGELLERALGDACAESLHVGKTGRPDRHHFCRSLPPSYRSVLFFLVTGLNYKLYTTLSLAKIAAVLCRMQYYIFTEYITDLEFIIQRPFNFVANVWFCQF